MAPAKSAMEEKEEEQLTVMAVARREAAASVAVEACMVAAAAGGAILLAWWALAFHPSNSHQWMVPVGLVLACTPAVVFVALTFSGDGAEAAPLSASAVVVVETKSYSSTIGP